MASFQDALDTCFHGWHRGDTVVLLQSNIQELFGDMLMQYFEHSLIQQVGQPVTFAFSNSSNGGQTVVTIPENKKATLHLQPAASSQTQAPQKPPAHPRTTPAGVKKAPRPMNCWILFRDSMHKQLKAENPHLTVQQICKLPALILHEGYHG